MDTSITGLDIMLAMDMMISEVSIEQAETLAERDLEEACEHETAIGTIADPHLRRMWAACTLGNLKSQSLTASAGLSLDKQDSARFAKESARLRELSASIRLLFFTQAQHDFDSWEGDIGIRRHWLLVTFPHGGPVVSAFGFRIPIPKT